MESEMAKGRDKPKKEAKKPKAEKPKPGAVSSLSGLALKPGVGAKDK
jgi:hypothetical protein